VAADKGKNFVAHNTDARDDNRHGTHVASIIAANANNHYSIAGINPFAKILPVKVLILLEAEILNKLHMESCTLPIKGQR
jgi:subtilisin family serine protease